MLNQRRHKIERRKHKLNRPPWPLMAVWSVIGIVTLFRVGYDLSLYFYGGTVTVRWTLPYDYLVHFPVGYHDFDGPRPLIVFLHGAGEVGLNVTRLKQFDVPHFANGHVTKDDFPFIVVTPVTLKHGWEPWRVKLLVDKLVHSGGNRLKIDPNRVYLTGFSMGGFGTFQTAEKYPDLFTAIAPVSGGGDAAKAKTLKLLPIRAFHGDADNVVDYQCSVEMIDAVKKAGNPDAELVTIPGGGHGICSDAYGHPELYRWFLRHKK